MNGIDEELRDLLLCAVFSGNDWNLDEFKTSLEQGIDFIDEIIDMKINDPVEFKKLQGLYNNRWNV